MGRELPDLDPAGFDRRLRRAAPCELEPAARKALYRHYRELRRWNRRLSLVGPGTPERVIERHYGESLAALPLLPAGPATLVDVGSGAGFPGWVLAAARPDLRVVLLESRERKWAFLETVTRGASLSCTCLNARVGGALPADFPEQVDVVTVRAVRLSAREIAAVAARIAAGGRFLLWAGRELPAAPAGFGAGRAVDLADSRHRRIVEWTRA